MKNLVLVGFMGSGKTDAGKLAAARLGMTFVDMDEIIERRHGQTISSIFEAKGETFFRLQERALVRELADRQDRVIATVVICCWVDAKVAYERTKNTKHRPLLGDQTDRLARIETLLRERQHLYKAIPNRVDTSAMSVEQQTDEILRIYKQQQAG
jgi:shikimate kinase